MKAVLSFLLFFLYAVMPVPADIFFVATNSPDDGPGTHWTNAFHDIQGAIDVATNNGDVVRVTNGVYATGGAVTPGSTAGTPLMCRIVVTNAITIESVNGPQFSAIVGQWPPGNSAVRCAFLTNNAVLSGFTLTNGCTRTLDGDTRKDRSGGGAFAEGATVTNCIIVDCACYAYGGGVYGGIVLDTILRYGFAPWGGAGVAYCTARDCYINDNECDDSGAGAYQSTLIGCTIITNIAQDDGGGASLCTVSNCVFKNNWAADRGGGTHSGNAYNSLYIGNYAGFEGGGMYKGDNYNCTVVGNSAGLQCGGVSDGGSGGDTWYNCIIYYNTASNNYNGLGTFHYSCSTVLLSDKGSFTNPPIFVDTNGWADLRLATNSPCRDTGTNENWMFSITDLDGAPRIINGRADMGCYEYVFATNDYDGDGLSNDDETGVYFTDQAVADTDGDTLGDGDEVIAGTDPTTNSSCFLVTNTLAAGGWNVIEWYGVSGRRYSVSLATNMMEDFAVIPGQTNLPGTDSQMSYTNTAPAPKEFYRIGVSLP